MSIASLPAHTCLKNSASMIWDACTSLPSTRRSDGETVDRSVPIGVGVKRAAMRCRVTMSDTIPSWASPDIAPIITTTETTPATLASLMIVTIGSL
jgi:hypothetical protein